MNEEQLEQNKIKQVKEEFNDVIDDLQLVIKNLPKKYEHNQELLIELEKNYENKVRIMEESLKKPYFARIDFQGENQSKKDICYIGKVGVQDFDNNLITIDWRAPIASLYYDSNIGESSYKAPEGTIKGTLDKKRQYNIENGKLISFNDVDTVSNDEILKPYLSVNADNRLKNIVSSIQDEQNQIIREDLEENIIVQGVAGSGKTTVALHRIAYLAYNYRNKIKSNQYMVIGPNKFFINYISQVLPDLDVTDVKQLTYEEFTEEYLNETLKIKDSKEIKGNLNKYKMSMLYKDVIDSYVDNLEKKQLLPDKDFKIKEFTILPKTYLRIIYNKIDKTLLDDLESRIDRCILMTTNYIKTHLEHLKVNLNSQYSELLKTATSAEEKESLTKSYNEVRTELTTNYCQKSLKRYFTFRNKKTATLYTNMLKEITSYTDNELLFDLSSQKKLEFEDLPALIYLNYKLHGSKEYKNYRQVVIDEAQDYGTFNFYVLNKVMSSSTFSVFGDLAQSIYDYRSIDNWNSVIDESFNADCHLEYLLKSYRTTVEIMKSANQVLKFIGLKEANPVIRHGKEVEYIEVKNNYYETLKSLINELLNQKYESIALISRTDEEAIDITNNLKDLNIKNITFEDSEYNGGVFSLTSEVSKGLEFDAVIITDASNEKYHSNNTTDMKNLYVSMTRPLHELKILYKSKLPIPLERDLKEKTTNN